MIARVSDTGAADAPCDLVVVENWIEELEERIPVP